MRPASIIEAFTELFAPRSCVGCDLPGVDLCDDCRSALARPAGTTCARCGHPWPVPVPACPECPVALDAVRHAVAYVDSAPRLVSALKDGRRVALARLIGTIIVECVPAPPRSVGALVPVPLNPARERHRGFNQARRIADALSAAWAIPVQPLLVRARGGPPQRGASRTMRERQVQGAFSVPGAHRVPAAVVLVDDVLTTGATLSACARELRRAGVTRVGAVTFARVERGVPPRATIR